ncbi:glycoside hydrolase family 127 protein [Gaoshiqia sediminis]|uniref:Glycoside hydrolase family 127 protein n=1 Tax=Gaoshiqia sediminis TaxID=2986998 RepID=A0AA41Y2S1_9BACT|nr:glycoside hydrolase family 127 protein [Gaoshiqia sediminis]MCW0482391.1 glycoside hydrolase family 127 protein [Gaoshiqia sediminis]
MKQLMKLLVILMICSLPFGEGWGGVAFAQSHYPGQHEDKLTIKESAPIKAYAFEMSDIILLPSRFTENMERESHWIMSLGVDRLLHSFRTNAGVYAGLEGGYDSVEKLGGWESLDCELRGHTTGHILSGLAMLYATTGEEQYKLKADSLVAGLAEVQQALGEEGYLSAFPENLINRNIAGKRVWAPWYTLHKIYSGLIDQYLYCDNQQALDVVKKMADWAYNKLSKVSPEERKIMIRNEFGGMNDAFYSLYQITGNENYKWLAEFFYHEDVLDPLQAGEDNLEKMHANTFIPKLIGLTRAYEIGEGKQNKEVAQFFWNTVVDHHSFCTGSNSDKEKFFKPDHQSHHLTGYTGESCNVYNMLKLTRHLFCLSTNVKEADYYERALYNHILGQQDPQSGMVAYFLPMLPGAHKVYSTPDSSFWCCVGTGFESHAKYGEAIYYHNGNELFVNLFVPSELNWEEQNIQITQETQFPQNGKSGLTISTSESKKMKLKLRYPSWATAGAVVKVNGKKIQVKEKPGSYITLDRTWENGDHVEFDYPMELKVNPSDNPEVVSISYGPIVLAAEMGTEGMKPSAPISNPEMHNDYYTYDFRVPAGLTNDLAIKGKSVEQWLKPVDGKPLTFITDESITGKNYTFVPLYNLHRERYVVYWNLK